MMSLGLRAPRRALLRLGEFPRTIKHPGRSAQNALDNALHLDAAQALPRKPAKNRLDKACAKAGSSDLICRSAQRPIKKIR